MKAWKRHYILLITVVAFLSIGIYSCKDDEDDASETLTQQDRNFAGAVYRTNLAEIQLSQLAVQRATNDSIIAYARDMIREHTATGLELDSIAGRLNIALPDSMSRANQDLHLKLSGLNGVEFDTTYISSQVDVHQATRTLLEEQTDRGDNDVLIGFAEKQLPVINQHLQDAMRLRRSVTGENEAGGNK